jgi:hypothetical protein
MAAQIIQKTVPELPGVVVELVEEYAGCAECNAIREPLLDLVSWGWCTTVDLGTSVGMTCENGIVSIKERRYLDDCLGYCTGSDAVLNSFASVEFDTFLTIIAHRRRVFDQLYNEDADVELSIHHHEPRLKISSFHYTGSDMAGLQILYDAMDRPRKYIFEKCRATTIKDESGD